MVDMDVDITKELALAWSDYQSNKFDDARTACFTMLKMLPTSLDVMRLLSLIEFKVNNDDVAARWFDQSMRDDANQLEALCNYGLALQSILQVDRAIAVYDKALLLDKNCAPLWFNRGNALYALQRFDEALISFDEALKINPRYLKAWANRGMVLQDQQHYVKALDSYDRAIDIDAQVPELFVNRGAVLQKLQLDVEAITCYQQAINLDAQHVVAYYNMSFSLLALGDMARGWQAYEWRIFMPEIRDNLPQFSEPKWLGQFSLAGKTIFLYTEQGFGDAIQFCRYIAYVAKLGARVLLGVQPALAALFSQLPSVHQVITPGQMMPAIDCHCPLMSLPLALQHVLPTIPNQTPYLSSDPACVISWDKYLGTPRRLRIGLVWSGGTKTKTDFLRSIRASVFTSLLSIPADFFCLQQDLREVDKATIAAHPEIHFLGEKLENFVDTAAVIELLDLVISVDTSVAHLAGAMGKKVWVLLPASPDWRWRLTGEQSEWYPSMFLFRQTVVGDWDTVMAQVKKKLLTIM